MTKISLIAILGVWQCVVCGQLPINSHLTIDPYHLPYYIPYTSTFFNQPTQQNYGGPTSGENDELRNTPNTRNLIFQASISLKLKQLETITASLTNQLQAIKNDLVTKAKKSDLDKTNNEISNLKIDVSNLDTALQTTNGNLAGKVDKRELEITNDKVSVLDAALQTIRSPSSIGTIPTSCVDLKNTGFVKSGIYSVMVNKQVKNVYCDFTKSDSADFQKLIGIVDVKSTAVYFNAQRSTSYSTINTVIPFDSIRINVGNALSDSGEFVAPTLGIYYFAFSGFQKVYGDAEIVLQMKTATEDWTVIGKAWTVYNYDTVAIHSTLQLLKGDKIRLYLISGELSEDGNYDNSYVGWLIEERELPL